jgi:hypothetical protein
MTKYQLAKLIDMAGGLKSRKRVQKIVHLLQAAGCPFDAEYRLHYYGPYSSEVAGVLDQLSAEEILVETSHSVEQGTQYDYSLNPRFQASIEQYEQTPAGQVAKADIENHADLFRELCDTPPKTLELASTIVAFFQGGLAWEKALEETTDFKNEPSSSNRMIAAQELAKRVIARNNG